MCGLNKDRGAGRWVVRKVQVTKSRVIYRLVVARLPRIRWFNAEAPAVLAHNFAHLWLGFPCLLAPNFFECCAVCFAEFSRHVAAITLQSFGDIPLGSLSPKNLWQFLRGDFAAKCTRYIGEFLGIDGLRGNVRPSSRLWEWLW